MVVSLVAVFLAVEFVGVGEFGDFVGLERLGVGAEVFMVKSVDGVDAPERIEEDQF